MVFNDTNIRTSMYIRTYVHMYKMLLQKSTSQVVLINDGKKVLVGTGE